jgi:RNA polymerase sigma-32 factor
MSAEYTLERFARSVDMLDAETETELARAWRDQGDKRALHKLVNAYLRLGVSMARKFARYGAEQADLVQEAVIGLMKAAERFDPDRGVRFSSYATWWIKASLQDFVLRNHALVRLGSTAPQKSLYFNLARLRAKYQRKAEQSGQSVDRTEMLAYIAMELNVPLHDVEMMEQRLSGGSVSLNAARNQDGEGEDMLSSLPDPAPQAEQTVANTVDSLKVSAWLSEALAGLNAREERILRARMMTDQPRTLESLGVELSVSKERIRQIETQALQKLRAIIAANPAKRAAMEAELVL